MTVSNVSAGAPANASTDVTIRVYNVTYGKPGDPTLADLQAGGLNGNAAGQLKPDHGYNPLPALCDLARSQGVDPRDPAQRQRFIAWLNGLSGKCKLSALIAIVKENKGRVYDHSMTQMQGAGLSINTVLAAPQRVDPGPPAPPADPTAGFHHVGPGDSLWSIAEANLDKLLTDEQKKADVSHDQKVQWGVEELERRNPERKFNPALQDGNVDTPTDGQAGSDPDLINDGEWIRVDKAAGAVPAATKPVSTTASTDGNGTVPLATQSSTTTTTTTTKPVAFTLGTDPLTTVFAAQDQNSRSGYAFDLDGKPTAQRKPATVSV